MQPRTHLAALSTYKPIEPLDIVSAQLGLKPSEIIKLDANENPYGPLPIVREALANIPNLHLYPDPEYRALRQVISEFTGVPTRLLLVGAGADELIDLLLRIMVEPGESVLVCPPTFGMYEYNARLNNAYVVEQPRMFDFSLDLDELRRTVLKHRPKLLFLATPNNPDGSLLSKEALEEILELPTLVVLDEAYIEFADDKGELGRELSFIRQVVERKNLVVLRTFSKWAGLAGLRIGYGAFPDWLMPTLWKAKQPYNVNVVAEAAAILSLQHSKELSYIVKFIIAERQRMYETLSNHPFLFVHPSKANFLLVRVKCIRAMELQYQLRTRFSIFVRYFDSPRLQDCIRISIGRPQDTDALVRALSRIYEETKP